MRDKCVYRSNTHLKKAEFFYDEWLHSDNKAYLKKAKGFAKAFLSYPDTCFCQRCGDEKEHMRKITLISERPRMSYSSKMKTPSSKPLQSPAFIHFLLTEIIALLFNVRVPSSIIRIFMILKNKLIGNQQIAFIGLLIVGYTFLNANPSFSKSLAQYVPFSAYFSSLSSTEKAHLVIDITSSIEDEGNILLNKIQNAIEHKATQKFDLSGFNGKDLLHAKSHNTIPVDWYKDKSPYSDFLHLFPTLPWDNEPIIFISDLMHNPEANKNESHYDFPKEALLQKAIFPHKVLDLKIFYLPSQNKDFSKKHVKFWKNYFQNVQSPPVRIFCPDTFRRGVCDGSYTDGLAELSQMHGT
jgi:hypothetical protein